MNDFLPPDEQAYVAFRLLNKEIQLALLEDASVERRVKVRLSGSVQAGDGLPAFTLSRVLEAINAALSGISASSVTADDGSAWGVRVEIDGGDKRVLLSCSGQPTIDWQNWFLVSPSKEERLSGFGKLCRESYFGTVISEWLALLSERPLTASECMRLSQDAALTVPGWHREFAERLAKREVFTDELVPKEPRYFERLVGPCKSSSLQVFLESDYRSHVASLLSWDPREGARIVLASSAHLGVTIELGRQISSEAAQELISLAASEDAATLTQIGALELASALKIAGHVGAEAISGSLTPKGGPGRQRMELLSELFVFVDGTLSRQGTLSDLPPFYRRLASMSHASQIEQALRAADVDVSNHQAWGLKSATFHFYYRSLLDLQKEPRWHPEYASAHQFEMELLGRLTTAYGALDPGPSDVFPDLDKEKFLERVAREFPYPFIPGPLEGGTPPSTELPEHLGSLLSDKMTEDPKIDSFNAIVSCASIYAVGDEHLDLAAEAIRRANHILTGGGPKLSAQVIQALGTVAASTRSESLATEVRSLVRRSMRLKAIELSPDELFTIVLTAAGAFKAKSDWNGFTAGWLSEIAYSCEPGRRASELLATLKGISGLDPELVYTVAPMIAALEAASEVHAP